MGYQNINFQVEHGIATIELNRPRAMNSMNFEMVEEMLQAIDECAENENVRVVVVTGNGKVFSAGDDIKILDLVGEKSEEEISEAILQNAYPMFIKKIMSLPKPVIACVNGLCYGAGTDLALACDYVIASEEATFGHLYINLGLIGNTYLLPRNVGLKKALELIWTGRVFDGKEAYQMGLINAVVPAESLQEKTYKIAGKLAKGPTVAYGMAKKAMYESLNTDLDDGLKLMASAQASLFKTKDHKEGVKAFLEKRKPEFTGK
jgi:2-(1,2-epoxy-1,2-dihydrophenyl)acetyl-CoA isomerase